jgi:hypothetical protein
MATRAGEPYTRQAACGEEIAFSKNGTICVSAQNSALATRPGDVHHCGADALDVDSLRVTVMAAHLPLTELARVLHQHLTCLAPPQQQDQPELKFQEIEQALAAPETTIFICGESGRLPQMPLIDGTYLCDRPGESDFVINEFDDVTTETEQKRFANFVQQLAEQRAPRHFVLCGVSKSVRELLKAHESSYDYAPCAQNLRANVSANISSTRTRDFDTSGSHHVYVLSEKLFWEMLNDPTFARSIR